MDANITRETLMFTDSDDEIDVKTIRNQSKSTEEYPDAFLHAIRDGTVASFVTPSTSTSRSSSIKSISSSDDSYRHSTTRVRKLTMIPESVMAALTNIQQNQLRRLREDASYHLEDILRNVVKTVDVFYTDELTREVMIPAKRMIGDEENEQETRIKEEIKKILKGDIDDKRASMCHGNKQLVVEKRKNSVGAKDELLEEEEVIATVTGEAEEPVCQVMLNIIDDLCATSYDRQAILTEVLEWMERYPPGSLPPNLNSDDDNDACAVPEEIEEFDEETVFGHWEVTKNIRRLTLLSEEMGLVKFDSKEEEKTEDKGVDKRKLLEEKMNKQKSKYIATKVFDIDALTEPKNWRTASSAIIAVLEDATATSTNPRSKQMFGNAHKQFRAMTELAEKRQEEKTKLELQLNNVTGKLNKEKKEVKSLRKKKQALETQAERFQDDITDLKKEVDVRDDMIKERAEQIYELEVLNDEQGETLRIEREAAEEAKKQPPPVAQPLIQPSPQQQPQQTSQQQKQQPQQQSQQQTQPQQVTSQPTTTNSTASKEQIPSFEKQQPATQPAKQKTTKKAPKEGGLKAKKESKEDEKKKKQEKSDTRRTSVIMSLKEAKAELEEIKKAGEARENLVKELTMKVEAETAKFEQEMSKLGEEIQFHKLQTESVKKQLETEQEAWEQTKNEMLQEKEKLTNEVKAKEEIINFQEQRIQEVAREMTLSLMRAGLQANTSTRGGSNATDKLLESKQLLAKLHLQYEYEMEKLRTYFKNESERHKAETRRLDTEYKGNLNNIYRDTSVILRAVNRFKECLAALFDRENLADTAHKIRNVPNLVVDEGVTDPHVKLLRMAGGVIELMVQMEFKMSQGLMNKRMEIKDNTLEKNFLSKDLEAREDLLQKAREMGNLQAEKLKQARDELSSQEIELLKLKHGETDKYVDMAERNKELTRQNQLLNKGLTFIQKELQEETTAKETQQQEMNKTNSEMKTKLEKQEAIIASLQSENERILSEKKLHLKKYDMVRNVKLLNDALVSKKISQEKHTVAMTMIKKTNKVTGARLACLVRRYLLHKSWKKICEAMKQRHKSNKRPPKVEKYLKNTEERIAQEKEKLVQRKTEILQEKTEMYMHFKHMCNELTKEHGVHLIRPNVKKIHSSISMTITPLLPNQETIIQKKRQDHLKKMLSRPSGDFGNLHGVQGLKFFSPEETDANSWQFPAIETTQSSIVTPKILDMDMQKAQASCQRVLTSKSCGNFDKGLKALPWCNRKKLIRESLFSLPPIASLYPEN